MWSDRIYNFIARHRDGVMIFGVPAICGLAFLLLQMAGIGVIGTWFDYLETIFYLYGAVLLVLSLIGLIAEVCFYLEDWKLWFDERRLYLAELEARKRALEKPCTQSPDSF